MDLTTLHLNVDDSAKKRQNLKTVVYTNVTVGICLLFVLTTLVGISNIVPDSIYYAITEFNILKNIDSSDVANSGPTKSVQCENISHRTLSYIQKTWPRGKSSPPQWIVYSGCCDYGDQRRPLLLPAWEAHIGGGATAAK